MKTEILYGHHPVLEALRAKRRSVMEVCVSDAKRLGRSKEVEDLAESAGVPVKRVPMARIQALADTAQHQGICARVGPYPLADIADMLPGQEGAAPFLILLDNIVDPHNLGALIRTAFCVGAHGVVVPKDRSAPPSPAVSKSSAGVMEHVLLARITNMTATIKILQQQGLWVMGLDKPSGENIYRSDLTGPLALVVGSEERGIRPLVRRQCDRLISIPQSHDVDSLNASVAGAVAMYEAFRQRQGY